MPLFICQGCGTEHQTWEGTCPNCGTSETIRLAANTDRMIDRVVKSKFRIIRKLGQGGMGAVYLAEQVGIGQRVALKFLKAEFSGDAEIARRFLNEAKSYARVAHPNAVALHDFGQDDEGNLFIAMEYCEGVDLKKVIAEQGRLPLIEGIDIVLQVADVLANAHEKGVVHRDLKPENIMIRRGMRGVHAKVLDFGIARLMDASTKLTVAGAIAGTPRYMSPEQVEGREVDHRADVYSLGIVLFELLTGRQPFDGATIAEILRRQALDPLPHLVDLAPDLDYPDLDAVVQKACQKKRSERWPDMLTFASALSQAVPTQAHLGMSPLQRSSVHLAMPTGAPGQHTGPVISDATPSSQSGIATPGSGTEGADAHTLVKPGEATPATRVQARATDPGQRTPSPVPDLSMAEPLRPPTSKAPLIAAGVAALAVLGGVAWLFVPSSTEAASTPQPERVRPEVVKAPEVAVKQPDVAPGPTTPPGGMDPTTGTVVQVAVDVIQQEQNRNQLANGQTEFQLGKLKEAETYLSRIPASSDLYAEAGALLARIKTIRSTLDAAEGEFQSGHCERAVPLFDKVLALNPNMASAARRKQDCRAAQVPDRLE